MKNSTFENFDCGDVIFVDPYPIFRNLDKTIDTCVIPFFNWKRILL